MKVSRPIRLIVGGALVFMVAAAGFVFGVLPKMRPAKISFVRWAAPAQLTSGTFEHAKLVDADKGGIALTDATEGVVPVTAFTGKYYSGSYTSPVAKTASSFNWAVASWEADTPPGTWIRVELRATVGDRQTSWYTMGIWASDSGTIKRQSVGGQGDADGKVSTDTLILAADANASALQYRVTLYTTDPAVTPEVRAVSVVTCSLLAKDRVLAPDRSVWGTELAVPERSQMDYLALGGSGWCSPTSTSMVMAYWAAKVGRPELVQTVPDIAAACYDTVYQGTGNWPFNTAAAASFDLSATVTRFESLAQVEQWIKVGVPVVIGIRFVPAALTGSPIASTDGHLILVRGFDAEGNVICNDPAVTLATGKSVRIVYDREQLADAWLGANGIAYLIYPEGQIVPAGAHGAWEEPATGK